MPIITTLKSGSSQNFKHDKEILDVNSDHLAGGLALCGMQLASLSFCLAVAAGRNSPRSAEISHRHKETNTQDFRSVYFNLFIAKFPTFRSLFYTTTIPYKPFTSCDGDWKARRVSGFLYETGRYFMLGLICCPGEGPTSIGLDSTCTSVSIEPTLGPT